MARLIARVAAAAALAVALASPLAAQRTAARFFVDSVADTTFAFRIGMEDDWVGVGAVGVVVDPARRDALVAEFRVLSLWGNRATALVTGQITFVTASHVVLLEPPRRRFFRDRRFWNGALLGLLLGVGGGVLIGQG
jgi:hypothetical protein